MVEVQTGKKVKKLRTDNGLEFLSEEFNQFCRDEGMVRHRTVTHMLQQNDLAERMKRTPLESISCMLLNANMLKKFWDKAVNTTACLINRCPLVAINFKTPKEIWTGTSPIYDENLKVFGCVAYIYHKQEKLDFRAKKCMFIGYPGGEEIQALV